MTGEERREERGEGEKMMYVPESVLPCPKAAKPIAIPIGVVTANVNASVGLNIRRNNPAKTKTKMKCNDEIRFMQERERLIDEVLTIKRCRGEISNPNT